MRSIKKIIAAALAAALIGTVNAYAAVSVQMNNVTTAGSVSVSFEGDTNPIIVNDVTLVPARVFAQSTGMEILLLKDFLHLTFLSFLRYIPFLQDIFLLPKNFAGRYWVRRPYPLHRLNTILRHLE